MPQNPLQTLPYFSLLCVFYPKHEKEKEISKKKIVDVLEWTNSSQLSNLKKQLSPGKKEKCVLIALLHVKKENEII